MSLNGIKLTWLGHATFRFETPGGKTILVNPWVMGNPMCPPKEKDIKKSTSCCAPMATVIISATRSRSPRGTAPSNGIPELCGWLGKRASRIWRR